MEDVSSLQFSVEDEDDDHSVNDMVHDEADVKLLYSFPKSKTATGVCTHRMKYRNLDIEAIQKKIQEEAQELSTLLNLDYGNCILLLMYYFWNKDKLLDEYMNCKSQKEFLEEKGLFSGKLPTNLDSLITKETNENTFCGICYCTPTPEEPMSFFSLYGCHHKFCTECYVKYVDLKNAESALFIECPFSAPTCHQKMGISELKVLSDYNREMMISLDNENRKLNNGVIEKLLSEEEVVKMYHLSSGDESEFGSDEDLDNLDIQESSGEKDENVKLNELIYDFQAILKKREKEESEAKYNKTILSKYWYNIANNYCLTHSKKYKHCPVPDCSSVVEHLGFDSNEISNIKEHSELLLIPIVRCGVNHQFCFACNESSHAPCPCQLVAKWNEKSKDESETLKWIQVNTKDCPKCNTFIEKNGGCNHMTCRKCGFEFCWICLGDWTRHSNNYNCSYYVPKDCDKKDSVRLNLERYMFHQNLFNTQRISYEKDCEILQKVENQIKEIEISLGISWIETMFYKDCLFSLLECRETLKWSYAFLFYIPTCRGKHLVETAQWQLSNEVEKLSKLFSDVPISCIISKKNTFIKTKSTMLQMQEKFLETCIDIFADKNTFVALKSRLGL